MRATVIYGPHDIRLDTVDDPGIERATDAVVRVSATCVCGSDLWSYRGVQATDHPHRIGHEFVGVVEAVGADVRTVSVGEFVIAPFAISDGTCVNCVNGVHTSCVHGSYWGAPDFGGVEVDGAQGEYVRVPLADGTLVATPEMPDASMLPDLLTLSDVMGTGHHAAVSASVSPGDTVAVVGDGAVGLSAVLAAARLGAARIVVMSRHEDRQRLAREFGATDVISERGEAAAEALIELLGGVRADAVLECVGTKESMEQTLACTRPGGRVGYVGVPAGGPKLPVRQLFNDNIFVGGGVAPVRRYLPELLTDVLDGGFHPGRVFDLTVPLGEVAEAYAAMDERRAIKSFVLP